MPQHSTHHAVVAAFGLAIGAGLLIVAYTVGAAKAWIAQLATLATMLTVGLQVLGAAPSRNAGDRRQRVHQMQFP
jgi:hypothetical protein